MTRHHLLLWSPRILAIVVSGFLGLFALDAFEPAKPLTQAIVDFTIHLVPAAIVLAVAVVAWRLPAVGGVSFLLLAAAYAVAVRFRLDWIVAISGPLFAVGVLFLWSWRNQRVTFP